MANTFAPFGFRQYSGTGSAPTYEQVTLFGGIDYNQSAIYYGDPVQRVSSSDGTIKQGVANGSTGSTLAGVFVGCKYLSTSQKRTVWSNYSRPPIRTRLRRTSSTTRMLSSSLRLVTPTRPIRLASRPRRLA